MNIEGFVKSLSSYSPLTDKLVTDLAAAIRPVAYILLGIFFMLELLELSADNRLQGSSVTPKQLASTAFAFAMGFVLINQSDTISNAILELANTLITRADDAITEQTLSTAVDIGGVKGWFFKNLLTIVAAITQYLAAIIVKILIMLRYYQLYIARALMPLGVSFLVNRTLRSISVNQLKLFGAYALQGLVLLIIIRIYPYIVSDELLKVSGSGVMANLGGALASITKGWIFIALVIGSGRYIKQFMGVS